jgi:hypothetical protein
MMKRTIAAAAFILICGACQRAPEQANQENAQAPSAPAPPAAPGAPGTPAQPQSSEAPQPPEPGTPGGLPDDRTPLPEPNGPIDPKSAEAAGQVVQHYGALIEQGRWSESWKLWSDAGAAKQFDRNWRNDSEVHMEIGKPGDMEGAAGSIYVTTPVVFYGKTTDGGAFRKKGSVILRRVNDVPGSTEAQRLWHIARIDLTGAG